MSRRLTYEYIKDFVENQDYKLLSDKDVNYKYNTYIKIQCSKGHTYDVNWNSFQSGNRCRECANDKKRLSYEYIYNYFKEYSCELLSKKYVNNRTPLEYICQCGTHDFITFNDFMIGRRCKNCKYNKKENNYKTKSFSEIKEYIESRGYTLLSNEYINCKIPLLIQCPNKHNPYLVTWNNFYNNKRCPECAKEKRANAKRLDFNGVKDFIINQGYRVLSNTYKNNFTKLILQCPKGHIFKKPYNKFKQGQRCPICYESNGEQIIRNYLVTYNIKFKTQYKFKNLVSDCGVLLRFDFAIFDKNNNLICLIEYQGQQHYEPVEYFGGKEQFQIQQEHDRRKRNYCINNNIKLLEIPYWDFNNVEEILKEQLLRQ